MEINIEVTSTLMSKRGSNSELFAHENDTLPLGHSSCLCSQVLIITPKPKKYRIIMEWCCFVSDLGPRLLRLFCLESGPRLIYSTTSHYFLAITWSTEPDKQILKLAWICGNFINLSVENRNHCCYLYSRMKENF